MENETTINDLNVNETVEAEIKGGPKRIFIGGLSVTETALPDLEPEGNVMGGRTEGAGSGGPHLNHNETVEEDEQVEAETLNDLAVENDAQVKGGTGGYGSGGGVLLNHNETTAEDEEAKTEALDNLPANDGREEKIKGGRMHNNKPPELGR